VVDEVVSEQRLEQLPVALALHFLSVAADNFDRRLGVEPVPRGCHVISFVRARDGRDELALDDGQQSAIDE
jgi:hypothetical protein